MLSQTIAIESGADGFAIAELRDFLSALDRAGAGVHAHVVATKKGSTTTLSYEVKTGEDDTAEDTDGYTPPEPENAERPADAVDPGAPTPVATDA